MAEHKNMFPIVKISKVFGVSRSDYYSWMNHSPSDRTKKPAHEMQIKQIFLHSGRTYGSPRIRQQLLRDGETASRPKVARLMKKRAIAQKLTFHSNRGINIVAKSLGNDWTPDRWFAKSMSRKDNCWDDAAAENFFKTLVQNYLTENQQLAASSGVSFYPFFNNSTGHKTFILLRLFLHSDSATY